MKYKGVAVPHTLGIIFFLSFSTPTHHMHFLSQLLKAYLPLPLQSRADIWRQLQYKEFLRIFAGVW